MDFSNRSTQPQATAPSAHSPAPISPAGNGRRTSKQDQTGRWFRLSVGAFAGYLGAIIILVIAVLLYVSLSGPKAEDSYVQPAKLQAVFLESGQVYFGNLTEVNNKYYVLKNIYYLQTSSSSTTATAASSTSVSLVKLGCELHAPYDQMVINATQVTFWENLQSDGQVATAVANFQKANPDGQKCSDQSASASSTSGTVQNAGTSATGTAGTATGTTTTPATTTTTKP